MLQVSPFRMRSAGLLTAGMVFGYAAFLLWSALSSEPDDYSCVFTRHAGQEEVVKVCFCVSSGHALELCEQGRAL